MLIKCARCGRKADKPTGAVNRAHKIGAPLFCGKRCFGLSRRQHKTKAQKKEEKRLYDLEYRSHNLEVIKRRKRDYHKRTYDPVEAAEYRKSHMARHVEYCRRPEYKEWKQGYDQKYRAQRIYGEFWEAAIAAGSLGEAVKEQISRYEIATQNGTFGKAQKRRRAAGINR